MKNFFEQQDEARQSTTKLVLLFAVTVVAIIVSLYGAGVALVAYTHKTAPDFWQPALLLLAAGGGGLLIGTGSLFKTWALRDGGQAVAEELGGRRLNREASNPGLRQLQNVVEEMAIAAGTSVPDVYLLPDEEAINAFAAGFSPDDAVIGVTRGCAEQLDRAELQGVIAHEFSHILNGDMRLNIRLMGLLHGILLIGILGRILIPTMGRRRYRRSNSRNNRGRAAIMLLGVALLIIGGVGFLCGRLIKGAVSRQREFLADASAVQFTRNPRGIGSALKKIGGFAQKAELHTPKAEEASHLFFGNALGSSFFGRAFATHPPLEERIRRIDPSFDGEMIASEGTPGAAQQAPTGVSALQGSMEQGAPHEAEASDLIDADHVVDQTGTLTPDHIAYGATLREAIPESLRHSAHDAMGAVAVAYGLLLDPDMDVREQQQAMLCAHAEEAVLGELKRLHGPLDTLEQRLRIPLLEITAPALRELSDEQKQSFQQNIRRLVEADDRLSIFEYALQKILQRRLAAAFGGQDRKALRRRKKKLSKIDDAMQEATVLLSVLARVGHETNDAVNRAFWTGMERLEGVSAEERSAYEPGACTPQDLDRALDRLTEARPAVKKQMLAACAYCVWADRTVTVQESELMRAIAIVLNCPMPPLLREKSTS